MPTTTCCSDTNVEVFRVILRSSSGALGAELSQANLERVFILYECRTISTILHFVLHLYCYRGCSCFSSAQRKLFPSSVADTTARNCQRVTTLHPTVYCTLLPSLLSFPQHHPTYRQCEAGGILATQEMPRRVRAIRVERKVGFLPSSFHG